MVVDVVVPSLSLPQYHDMVRNCVSSLRSSEIHHTFNVTLMESGPEFVELGQDNTLRATSPFNYNKTLDVGVKSCSAEWVVLANNDLVFEFGWFTEVLRAQELRPDVSSFSCWNPYGGWHEQRLPHCEDVREGYGIGYELCGWVLVLKREHYFLLNTTNDVTFWCSDNVYCDELRRLGLKHALVKNSRVQHLTSKTLLGGVVDVTNLTEGQVTNYENWRRSLNV